MRQHLCSSRTTAAGGLPWNEPRPPRHPAGTLGLGLPVIRPFGKGPLALAAPSSQGPCTAPFGPSPHGMTTGLWQLNSFQPPRVGFPGSHCRSRRPVDRRHRMAGKLVEQTARYCGAGYCPRPYAAACHRGRRKGDQAPILDRHSRFRHILRRATWIQGCRTPWVSHQFHCQARKSLQKITQRGSVSIGAIARSQSTPDAKPRVSGGTPQGSCALTRVLRKFRLLYPRPYILHEAGA